MTDLPETAEGFGSEADGQGVTGSLGSSDVRRSNLSLALRAVLRRPRTKARIAADIGLTKGAVGGLVAELEQRGLARLGAAVTTAGAAGRPGFLVEAVPTRVLAIGISFSVVYLVGTVADLGGRVVLRRRIPLDWRDTPPVRLVDEAVALIDALAVEAAAGFPESLLGGVAIGVPDLVDARLGVVRRSPTTGLRDYPLRAVIESRIDPAIGPVRIDNDANFGALAEWHSRSGQQRRNLLYVTGSYGVGGGIVAAGEVYRGASGFAGEIGHLVVAPGGAPCSCGALGCLEAEVGLAAFLGRVGHLDPRLQDKRVPVDEQMSLILAAARAGDARTLQAVEDTAGLLGIGLSGLINVLNPDTVVLGGTFARLFELLMPPLRRALHAHLMPELLDSCVIEPSRFITEAAALGAARSVLDRVVADPTVVSSQSGGGLEAAS